MKKFLFTLAMLLMAGAAFADSYLYINKADVLTGEQYVEVPVKAHFSEYVSAWQVTITLPDGINFDGRADVGQDMTIPYFTDRGKTANYTLSLSQNGVGGFLAASQQEGFYKLNGTWTSHGAIKWAPGDYDEMIILYLEVTDAYTGGDIMITTEPMSGADPRDIPKAVVDGGRTLPWVDEAITAAEPTLAVDNEENPTQVTTNGVLYYCNETMTPGAWNIVTAPYTLPEATDVEQVLHFMAYTPNDEGKNDSKFVTLEVTIPAKAKEFEGTADVTFNGNIATLTYTSNDPDATVEVKVGETATTVTWTYDEATKTYTATYEVEETATEPGEHSVTVTLTVTPSDNYTGDAVSDSDTYTYKVNDELKGDIELGDVTDDGKVTVTYTGDEEGVTLDVVVKDKDGKVVENAYADGVITLPDYGEYTVEVTAKADDYNDKPFDPETVKWEKKTAQKPTIERANLTDATCDIVITPDPATDGELTYDVDVAPLTKAATLTYERKDTDYPVHVTAQTLEGPTYQASAVADTTIIIPAKPAPNVYQTPDPKIEVTVDNENQKVIITVTGEGTVTAAVETAEGTKNYTDEDGDGKIVIEIPFGEQADIANVTATALATVVPDGYDVISETPGTNKKENIDIPALPEKTEKPTITYQYGQAEVDENGNVIKDGRYATITITNNDEDPDAVIEYWIGEPGEEPTEEDWLDYTHPVTVSGEGTYVVMARAKAEGKRMSDVAEETIKIDKTTSVNELVNGKTVAGVRYFNMAGQEMQEANGITIVVTTYTDGTTSAVKVIK